MAWLSLYRGYLRMYDFGYWCISVFVYWEFFYRAAQRLPNTPIH